MLLALCAGTAWAQTYPAKPVRIIVPYPPGGGTDTAARLVAQNMSASLGRTVIVENRPGANGNIGTDAIAKAAPDGYTLVLGHIGTFGSGPSAWLRLAR